MGNQEGNSQPNIARSSGTGEMPRKQGAAPTTGDVNSSGKIWDTEAATDPSGRVGDVGGAGGTGGTHSMPYDIETASDAVARQTNPQKGRT